VSSCKEKKEESTSTYDYQRRGGLKESRFKTRSKAKAPAFGEREFKRTSQGREGAGRAKVKEGWNNSIKRGAIGRQPKKERSRA